MLAAFRSLLAAIAFVAVTVPATAQQFDASLLEGLKARNVGPAGMSGRIADVEALASDPNHILVGTATGGVWMSGDGGLTFRAVFDDEAVASIGAVAINHTNPDILWVGTGEGNVRNSTSIGAGIYKSIDGGETWQRMGLAGTERINRIALDPDNPDIAYVAALGPLWSGGEDRGVYKTTDGGETWRKILYVDETTGATDIKMDPTNPRKLFAAMWQFRRWPYKFESGGQGSGLYVSHDGGESWTQYAPEDGIPEGPLGRAVFAVAPSDPDRVYALVEAEKSALLRSDDGGKSWQAVNTDHDIADRPFYYTELAVDPDNPNRVYNIATRVRVSIDGGKTFEQVEGIDCCAPTNTIHIDTHTMWIHPGDGRHVIVGNDGGLAISQDRAKTWRFVETLPLAQFYHIAVDDAEPYNIYGGLQDNGSWRGPSEVWQQGGIRNHHWQEVGFGDGFDTLAMPDNPRAGYTMSQGGMLLRWNLDTGEQRLIRPDPPAEDVTLRFNWNAGFAQDPFDPDTIYYGSQFVHKSTDRGETWQTISPDLTTANEDFWEAAKTSGGLTSDVTAAEFYTTISVIAPSPIDETVIWVGTDDGRLHVTRDGGQSWTSFEDELSGVRDGGWIPFIQASPHDSSEAFIVVDDHRRGDMTPYVFRAENYGERLRRIVDEDDASGYALSILQDHQDPNLMFLGTEIGLWVSLDGGGDWTKWTAGVPTVSVMDMAFQRREDDLVLGTHGRAVYVIDDYGALRGLSAADFGARFALRDTTDGQQYQAKPTRESRFPGNNEFRAENEPYGVMLTFMAAGDDLPHPDKDKERARKAAEREAEDTEEESAESEDEATEKKPDDEPMVTVRVADTNGEVIRTFKAPIRQGLNRVVWDMRRDGARPAPPVENPRLKKMLEEGLLPPGPEVPPGDYTVTLDFDDEETTAQVAVKADPRTPYTPAQMRENYAAQLDLLEMQRTMSAALWQIHRAESDIATLMSLIEAAGEQEEANGEDAPFADVKTQAGELKTRLGELEERFRVPPKTKGIVYSRDKVGSRLGIAGFYLGSTYDAPSSTAQTYIRMGEASLDSALDEVNSVLQEDLPALRRAASEAGLGLLMQTPVERQ